MGSWAGNKSPVLGFSLHRIHMKLAAMYRTPSPGEDEKVSDRVQQAGLKCLVSVVITVCSIIVAVSMDGSS